MMCSKSYPETGAIVAIGTRDCRCSEYIGTVLPTIREERSRVKITKVTTETFKFSFSLSVVIVLPEQSLISLIV